MYEHDCSAVFGAALPLALHHSARSIMTAAFHSALTQRVSHKTNGCGPALGSGRGPVSALSDQSSLHRTPAVESQDTVDTNAKSQMTPETQSAIDAVEQWLRQGEPLLA